MSISRGKQINCRCRTQNSITQAFTGKRFLKSCIPYKQAKIPLSNQERTNILLAVCIFSKKRTEDYNLPKSRCVLAQWVHFNLPVTVVLNDGVLAREEQPQERLAQLLVRKMVDVMENSDWQKFQKIYQVTGSVSQYDAVRYVIPLRLIWHPGGEDHQVPCVVPPLKGPFMCKVVARCPDVLKCGTFSM